jgi:uncharacterized protein (DUF488 family)
LGEKEEISEDHTKMNPYYTVGHSTRPIETFVELLQFAEVRLVVDVRSVPRSRTNPQYNRDALPPALAAFGVAYQPMPALGGLRGRQRGISPGTNAFWENESFHNYADYALSDAFAAGLLELRSLGEATRSAIMCAEALWWRCHRRIIADYLIAAGATVFHIRGPNEMEPARMTSAARPGPGGTLVYPAN